MAIRSFGQGATEYLVMLAAILVVALVALALLGFFPGMTGDAKISQSDSYWKSEARPIAVLEHKATTAGGLTLVLQNKEASGAIRITNISVSNASSTNGGAGWKLGVGETKNADIAGIETDAAGTMYDFTINFTYTTPNGVSTYQYGAKPLIGKYV